MTEQEPPATPDGTWSPPTGAPAPRPDPYAQFGNPLHDTWGKPSAETSAGIPPAQIGKARKDRPGLRWAIVASVLVLLVLGGWLVRDTIVDGWDWVYDKASELSGDNNNTGSGDTGDTAASPDADPLADATAADDRAFDDWMAANRQQMATAVDDIETTSMRMMTLGQEVTSGGTIDPAEYRGALVEVRDSVLRSTQILDAAPKSAIRDDFVTVMLMQVNELNQMIAAVDSGDGASLQAASLRLARASDETIRLCRQHGARARTFCE